jgi:uncharacterized protein
MTWTIAKNSIDYFMPRTAVKGPISIVFYGGEPLMEWPFIKRCVQYIRQNYRLMDNLEIMIATNLTLIKEEMINFFIDKDVTVQASINGPQQVHDATRIFPNGKGTHDTVIKKLQRIRDRDADYFSNRVSISCTIDKNLDPRAVFQFFNKDIFLDISNYAVNPIKEHDSKYFCVSPDALESYEQCRNSYIDLYLDCMKHNSPFNYSFFQSLFHSEFRYLPFRNLGPTTKDESMSKFCVPGQRRLFVNSDGLFYTCEKFQPRGYEIGNYKEGIDISRVQRLLEPLVQYYEEICQPCWAYRLCGHCFSHAAKNGHLSRERKEEKCDWTKGEILKSLQRYIYLLEEETSEALQNPQSLHSIIDGHQTVTSDMGKRVGICVI